MKRRHDLNGTLTVGLPLDTGVELTPTALLAALVVRHRTVTTPVT